MKSLDFIGALIALNTIGYQTSDFLQFHLLMSMLHIATGAPERHRFRSTTSTSLTSSCAAWCFLRFCTCQAGKSQAQTVNLTRNLLHQISQTHLNSARNDRDHKYGAKSC
eukprot:4403267-Amphidinium_carterae.1